MATYRTKKLRQPRLVAGFTIVELITVVLLLGVLSAVAFSRFGSTNAFEPAILLQQVDEQVRLAQKLATSRQDGQITFRLDLVADEWQTQVSSSIGGVLYTSTTTKNNSSILASSGTASANLSVGNPLQIALDGLGNLDSVQIGGALGNADMGAELQIVGDSTRVLCIYPSGYVSHNVCS